MRYSLVPERLFQDYTEITPELLQERGIRLLLTDLDYTLAPKRVLVADATVKAWVDTLRRAGILVVLLSNNRDANRGKRFCEGMDMQVFPQAGKPNPEAFWQAMEKNGCTAKETVMLGDKLLTDVLGAHRAGISVWMVEPKGGPVGAWNHVLHIAQRPFKSMARRKQE